MRTASGPCVLGIAALAALSMTLSSVAPVCADDYRRLSGAEIRRLIAGKAVTDEIHYTDHFRPNGVYEGIFMNKRLTGTWKTKRPSQYSATALVPTFSSSLCHVPPPKRASLELHSVSGPQLSIRAWPRTS